VSDVVVVPGAGPDTGTGGDGDVAAALAAGGAAVEAQHAAEDAAEAVEVAEAAEELASSAFTVAVEAVSRAEHAELVSRVGQLEDWRGAQEAAPVDEPNPLTPPRKETEPAEPVDEHDGQEPEHHHQQSRKYGNDSWFGGR